MKQRLASLALLAVAASWGLTFVTMKDALNRQFAATGAGPSGYQNLALQNYGQQYAGNYLQNLISNLTTASGAGMGGQQSQSTGPSSASPLYGVAGALAGSTGFWNWLNA